MHKLAQVELQLDRPQLPYSEILGPITIGGSPTQYTIHKKGPYIKLATSLESWETDRGKGKEKKKEKKEENSRQNKKIKKNKQTIR